MQHEALAALGESLGREFQELINVPLPPLAELTGDDLIDVLDGQLQGLAEWLISASLSVAPPPPEDAASDAIEQGKRHRPDLRLQTPAPSGTLRRSQPSETSMKPESPQLAPQPAQTLPSTERRDTAERVPQSGAQVSAALADGRQYLQMIQQSGAANAVAPLVQHPTQAQPPSASASTPLSAQSSLPAAVSVKQQPALPHKSPPTSTPAPTSTAPVAHSGSAESRKDAPKPAFNAGGFTITRNLHDLSRLLSSDDGHALTELNLHPSTPDAQAGEIATPPAATTADGRDSTQTPHNAPPAQLSPTWEQTAPVRVYAVQPAAPPMPPNVAEIRTSAAPEPATPEVDMDSLLDALARSVAEDYRRFYGS